MRIFEKVKVESKLGLDKDLFTKEAILNKAAELTAKKDIKEDVGNNEKKRVQRSVRKGF